MRSSENYTPLLATAFALTLAILTSFQIYILREPARIAADEARDRLLAVTAGRALYADNCEMCHGEQGEGVDGPALNDRHFLAGTSDMVIFNLINSGVPGTEMPAWNQRHGGPFTDQQVRQIAAFIRAWEPEAPDRHAEAMAGDPVQGFVVFSETCFICHGAEGQGTRRAPALNDPVKLAQFGDDWYAQTIAEGRPAQGMPTWGTVLAPERIRDIVALLRAWQRGETVEMPGPEAHLHEAMHMLGHGDLAGTQQYLEAAAKVAEGEQLAAIDEALQALANDDLEALQAAIHEAEALGGEHHEGMPDMHDDGEAAPQPGETEARAALEDLRLGLAEAALPKLKVARVLAEGELKEAVEYALEDIDAGRLEAAIERLEQALEAGH